MAKETSTSKLIENFSKMFLDPYDRPARLLPALLAILPIPVLLVCVFDSAGTVVVSVLGYCGAGFGLARFARNAGKKRQRELFAKWGGAPTTQLLRHSNQHFNPITKQRYHEVLSKGIGHQLPDTLQEEQANPKAADDLYEAATEWLIDQTRDQKEFPLVFKENIAFGFHRNALGVRSYGIAVALICLLISLFHTKVMNPSEPYLDWRHISELGPLALLNFVVSIVMLIAWLFWFNEAAAKQAGFAYAERLLQSCNRVKPEARERAAARVRPAAAAKKKAGPKKKP